MIIVEIIPALVAGGAENVCVDLCKEFAKSNENAVTLVVFFDGITKRLEKALQGSNINIIFLHKRKGFSFSFLKRLRKTILSLEPDCVHCHLHSIIPVLLCGLPKRISIFYTVHNIPQKDLSVKFRSILRLLGRKRVFLIGISPSISKMSAVEYPHFPVETIMNGASCPKELPFAEKKFDFVSCGRLTEQKNYPLMISAIGVAVSQKHNVSALIVGGGENEAELVSMIHRLGLQNNVVLSGYVDDPFPYLQSGRIFLLTSRYEGNPISIIEAMSLGLPIMATDVGGVSDVVSEDNGILFASNISSESLAKLLVTQLGNSQWIQKTSDENRLKAGNFTSEAMAAHYLRVFRENIKKEGLCKC